jgi:hypothetical protein
MAGAGAFGDEAMRWIYNIAFIVGQAYNLHSK